MQLLEPAAPGLSRIAVLYTDRREHDESRARELGAAADVLKVRLDIRNTHRDAAFEDALAAIGHRPGRGPARGLVVTGSPLFNPRRARLIAYAAEQRLPAIYFRANWADEGGLMAYGPNTRDAGRIVAAYVDKVLKGAKPGDLPVMQPTEFDFVINLKTARALGLEVPRSLLVGASRVIE